MPPSLADQHSAGVMFSISRSRYTLPTQFACLALNGIGALLAIIYNASTPDLYPNNAHHKLGWVLTWVFGAQMILGIICAYVKKGNPEVTPVSIEAMAEYQRVDPLRHSEAYCSSNDSGHGTESCSESPRSNSLSSVDSIDDFLEPRPESEDDGVEEKHALLHGAVVDKLLSSKIPQIFPARLLKVIAFSYNAVDRIILILGFVALTTGIVTYGGFFVGAPQSHGTHTTY